MEQWPAQHFCIPALLVNLTLFWRIECSEINGDEKGFQLDLSWKKLQKGNFP